MMKRVLQVITLLVAVDIIIDISVSSKVSRVENKLDKITYEINDIETEIESLEDTVERTRISEFDTAEQIAEEIRLGEMEMLAQLIHAEAGCEDLDGKRLVADVVLNRRDAGWADGTVEGVIFQTLDNNVAQFSTIQDGAYDKAGWEMTESDYLASQLEYEAKERLDSKIFYFRAGKWSDYGTHAYRHGGHYFSYE